MAKACAYLCRQCCFIDGFGEFGKFPTDPHANESSYTVISTLHYIILPGIDFIVI